MTVKVVENTDYSARFGDIGVGSAFKYKGVLYIKTKTASSADNAYRVGSCDYNKIMATFTGNAVVVPTVLEVKELTECTSGL